MVLPTDRVDEDDLTKPAAWHQRTIWRFMILFGLISSIFDFVTFYILKYTFHASVSLFRTGWFIESLLTEIIILLVIRTRQAAFKNKPAPSLSIAIILSILTAILFPFSGVASLAGLQPVPAAVLLTLLSIATVYFFFNEWAKRL